MLKIKDDIDLREFAKKYNFIYCDDWCDPYQEDNYGYLVLQDCSDNFRIAWREDWLDKQRAISIWGAPLDEQLDLLYDLIQDGLIEKIEEED